MQKVAGLGKVAWRETQEEPCFSAEDEQVQAFGRRSGLRESLLSLWQVDINQAFPCVPMARQTQIEASETPCVSFDRLDVTSPSETCELKTLPSFSGF